VFGYNGKALVVDLSTRDAWWEPLAEDVLRCFIGGDGLGAYLLHKHCPPGADPLSPDNPLIFVTSPLVGSRLTTSGKFAVVTKSPLTGFIGDSLSSSFLANELKKAGCDALVIKGRAHGHTLLSVADGEVEFKDAADLMGKSTSETEAAVKARMPRGTRVACIGPAGERLVRFASISNDGGRHAGRTGPGMVMGSKNLKAIAVRGNTAVPVADRDALRAIGMELTRRSLGPATEKYRMLGTVANMSVFNRLGTLPTRNFRESTFEAAEQVSGEEFVKSHKVKTAHCANCTIGCTHIMATNGDGGKVSGRMEYESAFALGPLVGIGDPNVVIRASRFCDEMGMDTISSGGTVAWAMECFDRGLLTKEDTGGVDLLFGDDEAVMVVLEAIAARDGIGNLLADGSRMASEAVGQGSSDWAMQVKGLEMPGYEPRSLKTMALGLAVSTRGACHNKSSAYEADFSSRVDRLKVDDERGRITMEGEDFSVLLDSLIWCKFLRKAFDDFYGESAHIYERITGMSMTAGELKLAGERINNLKKLFNIREGWSREDDTLPQRVLREKLEDGIAQGTGLSQSDLDMMIAGYYRARGWTEDGLVPDSKIESLDLADAIASPALA
jgi:aldehyde:ferredoxin oxidoreductase